MDIDGGVAGGPHIVLGQENAHSNDDARSHDRGLNPTCLDSHNLLPHPGDAPPTSQARAVWARISVLASWPTSDYTSKRQDESRLSHFSISSDSSSLRKEARSASPRWQWGTRSAGGSVEAQYRTLHGWPRRFRPTHFRGFGVRRPSANSAAFDFMRRVLGTGCEPL
jgi:hypothetical protein